MPFADALDALAPEWVARGERTPEERQSWIEPINHLGDAHDGLMNLRQALRTGDAT